jgi:hypothetical protein
MESQGDDPVETERQPFQFGLSKLLQLVTVAASWCSAGVVRENVTLAMAYAVGTTCVTWIVVGRWAVTLSPRTCRRVLAITTALLVAGGAGVTVLVDDTEFFPLVWMATALVTALPAGFLMESGDNRVLAIVVAIASGLLMLLIISLFWNCVFWCWDRMSTRPRLGALAWSFSILLGMLCLPLLLSVSGGCYTFAGHGKGRSEVHHVWLHCVIHVGMLAAAGTIIGVLQRHARHATGPPPNWLKLLTLGYLCLYAVLCQVALFPINFYIP